MVPQRIEAAEASGDVSGQLKRMNLVIEILFFCVHSIAATAASTAPHAGISQEIICQRSRSRLLPKLLRVQVLHLFADEGAEPLALPGVLLHEFNMGAAGASVHI